MSSRSRRLPCLWHLYSNPKWILVQSFVVVHMRSVRMLGIYRVACYSSSVPCQYTFSSFHYCIWGPVLVLICSDLSSIGFFGGIYIGFVLSGMTLGLPIGLEINSQGQCVNNFPSFSQAARRLNEGPVTDKFMEVIYGSVVICLCAIYAVPHSESRCYHGGIDVDIDSNFENLLDSLVHLAEFLLHQSQVYIDSGFSLIPSWDLSLGRLLH